MGQVLPRGYGFPSFERPVPTVKTLLHRGLAQLRECLSDG
jgi:hypothetical protein